MVAAIVIPLLLLYFYIVTKREYDNHHKKWINLDKVCEDSLITGKVIRISQTKKRFYYNKYTQETEIILKSNSTNIVVKKIMPLTISMNSLDIRVGDHIVCYGQWQKDFFQMSRYIKQVN
ncbi:hypothetical protein LCL95_02700 [Bacillus timonensis]|nr:hypothetical protein [Bacillus timonensis]